MATFNAHWATEMIAKSGPDSSGTANAGTSESASPSAGPSSGLSRPFLLRRKSNPTLPPPLHQLQADAPIPPTPPTPLTGEPADRDLPARPPEPFLMFQLPTFSPSGGAAGSSAASVSGRSDSISIATTGPGGLPSPPPSTTGGSQSTGPGGSLAATLEQLRYLAQKRITTFVYLKRAHEGKVFWFNTVLLTRTKLDAGLEPTTRLAARTTRFAVLGMSLSGILDITTVGDFVKAMMNLLQEYEAIPDANFRPKMKGLFRQSKGPRKSSASSDYPLSFNDVTDSSYLYSPNIPFDLDYYQVLYTLCDILVEVYQRILGFLSPPSSSASASFYATTLTPTSSSNPSTAGFSTSSFPFGASSSQQPPPTPLTATYFADTGPPSQLSSGAVTPTSGPAVDPPLAAQATPPLLDPALSPLAPLPTGSLAGGSGMLTPGPASAIGGAGGGMVGPATAELMFKIDSRLKRIITVITKEADGLARSSIKDELALLNPMIDGSGDDPDFAPYSSSLSTPAGSSWSDEVDRSRAASPF